MALEIPEFETQMRGFDRTEVGDYIARLHHEITALRERAEAGEAVKGQARADREHLTGEIGRLQGELARRTAEADAERERLSTEIGRLTAQLEQSSGGADSVEGMSDRIARMMRIASEEARRTKELARQDAAALTSELREQVEAARQDRAAASAALTEFQASTNARRDKILAAATAEAEALVKAAHEERGRVGQEIEEAERARRELYQRLAEEDERNRRTAQEALDEQVKLAWEDDERNRREAQRRLDHQLKSAWEKAEERIATLDREARLEASNLIATTKREAKALTDRARDEVDLLVKEREGIITHLNEIRSWIDTAVRDSAPAAEPAEQAAGPSANETAPAETAAAKPAEQSPAAESADDTETTAATNSAD